MVSQSLSSNWMEIEPNRMTINDQRQQKKSEFKGLIMEDMGPEIKYILEPQINMNQTLIKAIMLDVLPW